MTQRVLLHCTSMRNPFVDAWVRCWEAAGAAVAVLAECGPNESRDVPSWLRDRTAYLGSAPEIDTTVAKSARTKIESLLDGEPDAIFHWWGLHAMGHNAAKGLWPGARSILCVDTFPNAAVIATELRERARSIGWLRRVDSLVVTSPRMAALLRRHAPGARNKPTATVLSPFPASAHATDAPPPDGAARFIFTGRSDYIFANNWRMAKDDVSALLTPILKAGARVSIQRPADETSALRLAEAGFEFYEPLPRESLLNGDFARMIARHHGHLAIYNVSNSTIRRRVSTGLSTRFAVGLCAPTPMVVPNEATFARELFAAHNIGVTLRKDPRETIDVVRTSNDHMRQEWYASHLSWSAESNASALAALVSAR